MNYLKIYKLEGIYLGKNEITRWFSNKGSRNEVRQRIIDIFIKEAPGKGIGDNASKYIYYVETLSDGNRVYLERPVKLHKGFDFSIHVENTNYASPSQKRRNSPKHDDLAQDLKLKKAKSKKEYARLYELIRRIYECDDVSDIEIAKLHFSVGLPADHVLKIIKWFFIEQDIRYWNYSGRAMTWNIVPKP